MNRTIYLDNNSTTAIDRRVVQAMNAVHEQGYTNPASQHRLGQAARSRLEELRSEIIRMLGGDPGGRHPDRLVFTSGGTESNNLAVLGTLFDPSGTCRTSWIVSRLEHPSVTALAPLVQLRGGQVDWIPVAGDGRIRARSLIDRLSGQPGLVSLMLANNETGVVQPVGEIGMACRSCRIRLHTDAVQAVGKIPVDFRRLAVDMLSFSAHKFHGPRGIGGLLIGPDVALQPMLWGGFQQQGLRPGTEDLALVVGMHRALELALEEMDSGLNALRLRFEQSLKKAIPSVVIVGESTDRLPQTTCVAFPGLDRQALLLAADMRGLAISTGSACASGSSDPSPVLLAMGLPNEQIEGAIRVSLSRQTTASEIDRAVEILASIVEKMGS